MTYREENDYLKNQINLAVLKVNSEILPMWVDAFIKKIEQDPAQKNTIFTDCREEHLNKLRTEYGRYHTLSVEFFSAGPKEVWLPKLTDYIHAMFLNMGQDLSNAGGVVEQVYAHYSFIIWLNDWREHNLL